MSQMTAVDLFAGAGGSSTGAVQAGIKVLLAADHWADAIATHKLNHPETVHLCQDLHQADFSSFPDHDLLLASPSCVGHTRARGKEQKHHDAARSTAWAVVSAAEAKRPRYVVVENVPEFLDWVLYPSWHSAMKTLGYDLAENIVNAADVGVPQSRNRVYLTARRGKRSQGIYLAPKLRVPASTIIEWDCDGWSSWTQRSKPLIEKTLVRIIEGQKKYGNRFLLSYFGSGGALSLQKPLGALTTHDRYAVVDGDRFRFINTNEQRRAMGFPETYVLPAKRSLATHLLGNAVCPAVMQQVITALLAQASDPAPVA